MIITPLRARVQRVVKGRYTLPDIYFASVGGTVGQDCYSVSNSLYVGNSSGTPSGDYLYLTSASNYLNVLPIPGDERYRYFSSGFSYPISVDGTVTIGPERDIMGYKYDDPARTITIHEVLQEIAALLISPSATPTR
jgi:hypothetical protein